MNFTFDLKITGNIYFAKSDSFIIFMHEKLFGQDINCAKVTVPLYSSLRDCLVRMTSTFLTTPFFLDFFLLTPSSLLVNKSCY